MKDYFLSWRFRGGRLLDLLVETSYLLLIFLIPLWFAYLFPTYNMFELSKIVLFKILLCFFFITFLIWLLAKARLKLVWRSLRKEGRNKIIKLFLPPLALIIFLLISSFFSIKPAESIWGSYTRQQGVLSYLFYFLWSVFLFLYLLSIYILQGRKKLDVKIKRIIITVISSASLVGLYGVLQILNIDFLSWPEPPYLTGRALSTLGQPNFLASFLLLTIPLSLYALLKERKFFPKFIYLLALILQLACFFFTSSRGGLLALIAVAGFMVGRVIFLGRWKRKTKFYIIVAFFAFLFSGVFTMEYFIPGRIRSLFDLKAGSLAARVYFFQAASDAILDKPILGYGLETADDVFIKFYERDWGVFGKVGASADRAHNLILDILLNNGFIGLIFFVVWYYYYFRLGLKGGGEKDSKELMLAISLGSLGYFLSLFFSFIIVAGEIYFWLFFTLLAILNFAKKQEAPAVLLEGWTRSEKAWLYPGAFIIILFSSLLVLNTYKMALADYYQNKIQVAVNRQDFIWASELKNLALSLNVNPVQEEKINNFVGSAISSYCGYMPWRDEAEKIILEEEIMTIINDLKDDTYSNLFLKAKLYSCLNQEDAAIDYFSQVASISPEWPLNYFEWGRHYVKVGNIEEAKKYFQLTEINLPDTNSSLINEEHKRAVYNYKYVIYKSLAEAYMDKGEYVLAIKFLEAAYHNLPSDTLILKKIADCYYLLGNLEEALAYNLHGFKLQPGDYAWPLAIAALYSELNDTEAVNLYLDKALELAPEGEKERVLNFN
ncbi:MAG: O-antigen ligase family protein [Patescibacteria group bacterium]|nr:O-antigen ligase family protein [Patescibacteria group bacterium]